MASKPQVAGAMSETGFSARLKAKIAETMESRSTSIATGACGDYAAYREQVGYIRGLLDVVELCREIEKDY